MLLFLQSVLIERTYIKAPSFSQRKKQGGLNALNFVFDYLPQFRKDFGVSRLTATRPLSESSSKKIACINACSLSDNKIRAAFSLSTITAWTTVSATSTALYPYRNRRTVPALPQSDSPAAHSDKKRQKKNRKGFVTSTVIGDIYSVKWRFYFWFLGKKQRHKTHFSISLSLLCFISIWHEALQPLSF